MSADGIEAALEAARLEERERIAREVHDVLGSDLAAVKMALAVLGRRLPQETGMREQLEYVDKLIDGAIDSMHRIAEKEQVPPTGTLAQILGRHVDAFRRQSGLDCRCVLDDVPHEPGGSQAETLSRTLRECLVNIGKHARAEHVQVELHLSEGCVTLTVRDDGVGIGPGQPAARPGLGLRIMRERAVGQGGRFSIRPGAPRGTLVTVELPLANQLSSDKASGLP